jgi:dTMP kinase
VTFVSEKRGRFIVFEGGEGTGKSTQAGLLAQSLGAILTREPGGTAIGERIRQLLLDPVVGAIEARSEALLVAAARAQHVERVIAPALESGHDVVSDRYSGSSLAYQGYGRGLPINEVRCVSDWATGGVEPDLVILLDVSHSETADRMRATGVDPDRLEAEGAEFHRRVAEGFLTLAQSEPGWVVVDGDGPVHEVAERVATAVKAKLPS